MRKPGSVIDHVVEGVVVEGHGVVIVKPIDVHLSQADLIVCINSGGVEQVTHTSGGIRSGERQHRDILERQHSRPILCFGYLNQHQRLHNQCSFWASRVTQGLRHCIAVLEASLQPRVRSQSVSQPTVTS